MIENQVINPLSPKLRYAALVATRIMLGGKILEKLDGSAELTYCGITQPVSKEIIGFATILADRAKSFLTSYSYSPPYDGEAILRAVEFCQETLIKFFHSRKLRACFLQNGEWGCAYWRATEPVRMLNEMHGDKIYAESSMEINYEGFASFDVLVVQRGIFGEFTSLVHSYIDKLKRAGMPIIFETDDDLLNVPVESPAYDKITPETRKFIQYLIKESDGIFTTNERLSQLIGYEEKTHILENSLDFSQFKASERKPERENVIHLMWHGSQSHDVDFRPIQADLKTFIRDRRQHLEGKIGKQIIFGFFGYVPHAIEPFLERNFVGSGFYYGGHPDKGFIKDQQIKFTLKGSSNVRFYPQIPTQQFHQALINLQPDICFIPLNSGVPFNNSKSNIKFLESTLAGAACVVMDTGPYKDIPDDCAIKVRTSSQFFQAIRELIEKPERRAELVANATDYSKRNFDLKVNSQKWLDALMKVSGKESENKVIIESIAALTGEPIERLSISPSVADSKLIDVSDVDTPPLTKPSNTFDADFINSLPEIEEVQL